MNKIRLSFVQKLLLVGVYEILFIVIAMVLLKRVGAFGCFDDCFNYGAGYFLLQGKELYNGIFFNHQPFMAFISAGIQYISHPQTLFELIKYHRITSLLFANLFGIFLIFRFGFPLFLSLVIFESTKFYVFGDRFLAEGVIVYPMMYLALLIWNRSIGKKIYVYEYIVMAICSWFIYWMREPFIPWSVLVVVAFFAVGYKDKNQRKNVIHGVLALATLHVITFLHLPIREYVFNVIQANMIHEVSMQSWTVLTISQTIMYPLFILLPRELAGQTVALSRPAIHIRLWQFYRRDDHT